MTEHGKSCRKINMTETEKSLFEDEALETIWELGEEGEVLFKAVCGEMEGEEGVLGMRDDGLITIEGDKIQMTEAGHKRARDITRRHRLAERLFADVLALADYEADACRFEHAISPEVDEAICTFLGHPPTCPHGKAIPRGDCCSRFTKKMRPLVQALYDMKVGLSAKVVYITSPMMDRLASIGIVPGAVIRLQQKKPSCVVEIDETIIAVDDDIAREIYVKP